MVQRIVATSLSVVLLGPAAADISACGDKFLRIGRSTRVKTYAVIHPASILVYAPEGAKGSDVAAFERVLTRGGHRAKAVRTVESLAAALAAGDYDLVIAPLPLKDRVTPHLRAARSRPDLLPWIGELKKEARAAVDREFRHVLEPDPHPFDVLAEIDHTMKDRRARVVEAE
jgi:hypothetical protein